MILQLKMLMVKIFPYTSIAKDSKILFPDLKELGCGKVLHSNFLKVDTVKVLFPKRKFQVSDSLDAIRVNSLS
ncbi:hypothetical protein JJQ60_16215 [Aquimarina mytili]|uniref:Uncharacterized protein n=1 Tax=Aquimarina mytili TaxID=874423 RepID=A0A937DAT6_9FLAO|nr:hypothetical protein [Aquimarina mytili]